MNQAALFCGAGPGSFSQWMNIQKVQLYFGAKIVVYKNSDAFKNL